MHRVQLSEYWIERTPVTNGAYRTCVEAGVCAAPSMLDEKYWGGAHETYPAILLWGVAHTYCEWSGGSLPTEAQWEKAGRGTDGRIFPWGNDPPSCSLAVWSNCDMAGDLSPVGTKPAGASPYGVLDMAGDVREWTADGYISDLYSTHAAMEPVLDPSYPVEGFTEAVLRSNGIWTTTLSSRMRVSDRGSGTPDLEGAAFRCVYP